MGIGYRGVFRLDEGNDSLKVADTELQCWLSGKLRGKSPRGRLETADWAGKGRDILDPNATLDYLEAVPREGQKTQGGPWSLLTPWPQP